MVSIFNILRLSRCLGLGSAEVGGAFAQHITWLRASLTRLVYNTIPCQDDELRGQDWRI